MDEKVYTIIAHIGYVESAMFAPIIFEHKFGFETAKEALLDLHCSFASSIERMIQIGTWEKIEDKWEKEENLNLDVQTFIRYLQTSCNDDQPGGYDFWKEMDARNWNYAGNIHAGTVVTIVESAEELIASKERIIDHCDVFDGKFIPMHKNPNSNWPMSTDLKMEIHSVVPVPEKYIPPRKPS